MNRQGCGWTGVVWVVDALCRCPFNVGEYEVRGNPYMYSGEDVGGTHSGEGDSGEASTPIGPVASRLLRDGWWRGRDDAGGEGGGGGGSPGADAELRQNLGDVVLDGADADEEGGGDLGVGLPRRQEDKDFALASSERSC